MIQTLSAQCFPLNGNSESLQHDFTPGALIYKSTSPSSSFSSSSQQTDVCASAQGHQVQATFGGRKNIVSTFTPLHVSVMERFADASQWIESIT